MNIANRKFVPIVLFAFNRPRHLHTTLLSLAKNEYAAQSDLIIYCDGPRNEQDALMVKEVDVVIKNINGFHSVSVVKRDRNVGLAENMISGINEQIFVNDRIIVLEDDLVTSPFFLRFMNEALAEYNDDLSVASVHGYCFPCQKKSSESTFFLRGADCWGWGTWRRAWKFFNPDARFLYNKIIETREYVRFNRNFSYDYMRMLVDVCEGKVSSWAVRWLASAWINNMYTLYPRESLVCNIGMDGSGTHCGSSNNAGVQLAGGPIEVKKIPVEEHQEMSFELIRYLESDSGGKLARIKRAIIYYLSMLNSF